MNGKSMRMRRFLAPRGSLVVAADHGFSTPNIGMMWDMEGYFGKVSPHIDGIILHKGIARSLLNAISKTNVGLIVHTSGATQYSSDNFKMPVCSVREALELGADAISTHVNFGTEREAEMLSNLAITSADANSFGVPLMCMCYFPSKPSVKISDIRHAARVCCELGVDMIKVGYEPCEEFLAFCDNIGIPVFIAGGDPRASAEESQAHFKSLIDRGLRNFTIGRSIFTSDDPEKLLQTIRQEL